MIPDKPFTGAKPWALILCKFSNHPEEPQNPQYFRDFITRGQHGINDYFTDVSYGNINLDGSQVFGWFDLPYTLEVDRQRGRGDRILAAIDAVKDSVDFRPFFGICVMLNAQVDSGGLAGPVTLTLNNQTKPYGLVVLDNLAWGNTWAAQEMAHGFKLDHSWATDPDVEYGNPFDVMSAFMSNYGFNDAAFNVSGPGLNAPNLDLFGWLSASRIFDFPRVIHHASIGLPYSSTLTTNNKLTALNHPENPDLLTARINATNKDFGDFTYYVEYRVKDGWDRALPGSCVVIHQVRSDSKNYLVSLARGRNHLEVGNTFTDAGNGISISFASEANNVATVSITAPVEHHFREAVAGPAKLDWHIYESVVDILHHAETERIDQVKRIVNALRNIR